MKKLIFGLLTLVGAYAVAHAQNHYAVVGCEVTSPGYKSLVLLKGENAKLGAGLTADALAVLTSESGGVIGSDAKLIMSQDKKSIEVQIEKFPSFTVQSQVQDQKFSLAIDANNKIDLVCQTVY